MEVNSKDTPKHAIRFLYESYTPKNLIENAKEANMFILADKHKIYGTVSLMGNRISKLFVNPRYHRKGIGKKLMKYVEKFAQRKGIKKLRVRSSITAYGFYKKLDYVKVKKVSTKKLGSVIWMKKELQ